MQLFLQHLATAAAESNQNKRFLGRIILLPPSFSTNFAFNCFKYRNVNYYGKCLAFGLFFSFHFSLICIYPIFPAT